MNSFIIPGAFTALGIFILVAKMPRRFRAKLLGFDYLIDIAVTLTLMWAFFGTFSGMMAAIIGGINFSISLIVAKWLLGYEKPVRHRGKLVWVPVAPVWQRKP
jgi:hypothetical protein